MFAAAPPRADEFRRTAPAARRAPYLLRVGSWNLSGSKTSTQSCALLLNSAWLRVDDARRRVEPGRERADADAHRDGAVRLRLPVRELRLHDAAADALRDDVGLGQPRLRQKDAELLAAVARRHVGRPERRLQTLRGHLKRQVARLMAVQVVVVLEVVDVDHHETHVEAVALRASSSRRDALRGNAVAAGQGSVTREVETASLLVHRRGERERHRARSSPTSSPSSRRARRRPVRHVQDADLARDMMRLLMNESSVAALGVGGLAAATRRARRWAAALERARHPSPSARVRAPRKRAARRPDVSSFESSSRAGARRLGGGVHE